MSPYDVVSDMEKMIEGMLDKLTPQDKTIKVFTPEQHYQAMLKYAQALKATIETASYELHMVEKNGKEELVDGITVKKTEIEDLYIMQPAKYIDQCEHEDIMLGLSTAYDKGALKDKCMLVLPYDIRILKAKIAE